MSDTVQKLRVLTRVEIALLKIHARSLTKQALLCAAGLLLALLAVAMFNAAMYLFFAERFDRDVSALIVALINAVLAAWLFLTATRTRPGPEATMVEEIRDLAVSELQADAEAVRQNFNEVKADVQRIREGFGGIFSGGGPLRGLMHLGPLMDLLTSSLKRSKKK
jgi:type VI protein secretion system component VasK